jgi:hypothetical protein
MSVTLALRDQLSMARCRVQHSLPDSGFSRNCERRAHPGMI